MKFAFVNEDKIIKIEDHDDESNFIDAHTFQIVVDVTDASPEPKVGWYWNGKKFYNKLADVTPRQIRQALILSGVSLEQIDAAIDSLPEPTRSLAKVEWEYSVAFIRTNPLVESVGLMLGWTSEQLDNLWVMAGKL